MLFSFQRLQDFVVNYYFYILLLHLILIATFLFLNRYKIKKYFDGIDKRYWLVLLAIILFGLFLRFNFATMHDHTGAEWGEKLTAKYFLHDQKYHFCVEGNSNSCIRYLTTDHPGGYPLIMSFGYAIFGISREIATGYSLLFNILMIPSVFLISYILFKNKIISLLAAFMLSILPWHVYTAGTVGTDHISAFFVAMSILMFIISLKESSLKLFTLSLLISAYSAEIALENIALVPLFILVFTIKNKHKIKDEIPYRKLISIILVIFLILTPVYYFLIDFARTPWTGDEERSFSLSFLYEDLGLIQSKSFVIFSLPLILFFLVGILPLKWRSSLLALYGWLLLYLFIYGAYQKPILPNYVISILPGFSIFAGFGTYKIIKKLKKFPFERVAALILISLTAMYVYSPSNFASSEKMKLWHDKTPGNLIKASRKVSDSSWVWVDTYEEYTVLSSMTDQKLFIELGKARYKDEVYLFLTPHKCIFYDYPEVCFNESREEIRKISKFLFREGNVEVYSIEEREEINVSKTLFR